MDGLIIIIGLVLAGFAVTVTYFWIGMFLGSFLLSEEDYEDDAGFYWFTAWPVCLLLLVLSKLSSGLSKLFAGLAKPLVRLSKKISLPERFTVDPTELGRRTRAYRTIRSDVGKAEDE